MTDFIWPFRTKVGDGRISSPNDASTQGRRIDQGWDLQGVTGAEEECLALAAGTVTYAHDPGSNGAHFGDPYPILHLDHPVDGIPVIYYGHTHPAVPQGTHVNQGDVVARTSSPGGGGVVYGHWLEIGPWVNGPTGNGQWMHDHLVNAPTHQGDDPLSALNDAEQRELLDNSRFIRSYLANVIKPELDQTHDSTAHVETTQGNVVVPDVEAIKKHDGA